jgi:hypothetical protein
MTQQTLSATTSPSTGVATEPERGTRLRRRASAFAAFGAAGLGLAGFLSCNWENTPGTAAYLESLIAKPTQSMISMVLLHYGYLCFVPVAFVLSRLARRRAPVLAAIGLVLSVLGSGLSGFLVTDAYDLSIGQNLPMDSAVKVSEGVSAVAGAGMGLPTVLGSVIGLVLLLVAMWRARWLSPVPAILMLGGWVLSFGAHTLLRSGSGYALVALAFVAVGARILKMTDREFATAEKS